MILLIDIDHTIADSAWRDDMIGGVGGWDAYHAAAIHDKPIAAMVALVNTFANNGDTVCAITARPNKWRELTMQWFMRHGVLISILLMRKDNDYRPSPIMKVDAATTAFGDLKNVIDLAIDDRDDVCAAFRAAGVTTLQTFAAMASQRNEAEDGLQGRLL